MSRAGEDQYEGCKQPSKAPLGRLTATRTQMRKPYHKRKYSHAGSSAVNGFGYATGGRAEAT